MIGDGLRSNPYVGLRAFEPADSLYFFGRRAQVSELLQQLHETRFLAVVGSSGCGKSSLIRAGLIPALLGGFLVQDRDRWLIAQMKPGGGPIGNLALALCSLEAREPKAEQVRELEAKIVEYHVRAVVDHLEPRLGTDANLLLLLDQFEEIFAFRGRARDEPLAELGRSERLERTRREREAADFVDLVLLLAAQKDLPVYVVLTMRSDFLGDCDLFYRLPEAMNRSRYLVPRLSRIQLAEAIEGPPLLMGQRLAPRLVDTLLNELGEHSDQLPILQHALLRTWDVWQEKGGEGAIDLEHYEAAGTLREALPRHAEEALREADLAVTERLFRCLTDTDPGHRKVRRIASLGELVAVAGAERGAVEAILRRFNEGGFLLTSARSDPEDAQIEISHESLIRQWKRLAGWVDEEAAARDQFRELVDRARGGRALLRDPDLQIALNWRDALRPSEAWARRYIRDADDLDVALGYLERSHRARTEAAGRRRRRRNVAVAATVAVVLALSALTLWALDNAARARDSARVALAGEWMDRDPTRAALLVLEVRRPERTRGAAATMRALLERPFASNVLLGHEGGLLAVSFSPGGAWIVTGSEDGTARVWSADGTSPPVVLRGHEGGVKAVAFSPDGTRVATGSVDWTVRVWRTDGSGEPSVLHGHEDWVETVAFAPDGRRLVSASQDETARVWHLDGSGESVVLRGHEGPLMVASFSPDGSRIVTGSEDGTARVWSADGAGEPVVLHGHEGSVGDATFSADGSRIATGAADGTVRVWRADGSGEPIVLRGHGGLTSAETVAFSPDETQLVAALTSFDQSVARIWNADGSGEPIDLPHDLGPGGLAFVVDAAFSPDGTRILTTSGDGTARLWSPDGSQEPVVLRGQRGVARLAFSPDGRKFVTAAGDGTARVWSLEPPGEPAVLDGHADWVRAAAFSPDGTRIVTASDDGTARVWNADGSGQPVVLRGHEGQVGTAAFSPDGVHIATASDDGTARVWRADGTGEPVLMGHDRRVAALAFSPDGQRLATGSDDGTARVWSSAGSGEVALLDAGDPVSAVAFSPDGRRLATGSGQGTVRVWSTAGSGEPVLLVGHETRVETLAFSPDGTRIVTASGDGTARVWHTDGSGEAVVLAHEGWVGSAAFSPDGTRIVTASDDGTARVWNADGSGQPVVLRGHEGQVGTAAFSPDGTRIVTGAADDTARVWTLDGQAPPLVLRGHEGRLTAAAFSPDGSSLVTASTDGTARVWAFTADRLQRAIAAATQACLDPGFRENHLGESPAEARRGYEACERRHGRLR